MRPFGFYDIYYCHHYTVRLRTLCGVTVTLSFASAKSGERDYVYLLGTRDYLSTRDGSNVRSNSADDQADGGITTAKT